MNPRIIVSAIALVALAGTVHAAERLRIVDESRLPAIWSPVGAEPQSVVSYPSEPMDPSMDACVSLGYLIGKDGRVRPDSLGVLRLWSSDGRGANVEDESFEPYVQAAAAALLQQRYSPAPKAGTTEEVYTSVTLAFIGSRGSSVDNVQSRCDVPLLRPFLTETRRREFYKGETFRADIYRFQQARMASSYNSSPAGTNGGSTSRR